MPARFVLVSLIAIFLGCAKTSAPRMPVDPIEDEVEGDGDWRVLGEPQQDLATFVVGKHPRAPASGAHMPGLPSALARRFLLEQAELFGPAVTDDSLELRTVTPDRLGGAAVRFAVRQGGARVEGGDLVVALGPDGAVRAAAGWFPAQAAPAGDPAILAPVAEQTALERVAVRHPDNSIELDEPAELVQLPLDGHIHLCWRVILAGEGPDGAVRRELFVDAQTGAVIHEREGLRPMVVSGSGIDLFGKRRSLTVEEVAKGMFRLEDRVHNIRTTSATGTFSVLGTPLASTSPDRWDEGGPAAGAAVDAHANAAIVLDFVEHELGRKGLDGRDSRVNLVVHYGEGQANAFWDGHRAVFGDGDAELLPLPGALDVVAHELFHGVVEAEVPLVYERQSGALSESLSDVFGSLVENDDWQMGEDIAAPPLRDLARPWALDQPAHMSELVQLPATPAQDMGGVHANSTIPSHAAFLVAEGGTHPKSHISVAGIGRAKMRDIWWRAVTIYLTPRARFRDFAEATRLAAEDLFGPNRPEVSAVINAWRAVGVLP